MNFHVKILLSIIQIVIKIVIKTLGGRIMMGDQIGKISLEIGRIRRSKWRKTPNKDIQNIHPTPHFLLALVMTIILIIILISLFHSHPPPQYTFNNVSKTKKMTASSSAKKVLLVRIPIDSHRKLRFSNVVSLCNKKKKNNYQCIIAIAFASGQTLPIKKTPPSINQSPPLQLVSTNMMSAKL